jgi:thymidylate synthase (FAD)
MNGLMKTDDERRYLPFKVLDHGSIELEAFNANDLSVVNAARVSLHNHHDTMEPGDEKLISFLLRNHHGTPFEHNFFRFRIKAPIFVFREWHRHRIGHSYNEWSARYSELKGEFYIPENVRSQVGKPGHYTFEPVPFDIEHWFTAELALWSKHGYDLYKEAISKGVAKEQARYFLANTVFSEMYWSCNARSMMHWLNLRNSDKAQWEIHEYAKVVEEIFSKIMPITHAEFISNNREAP